MLRSAARLCAATIIREEKTQAVIHAMEALKRREKMVGAINNASFTLLSNAMDSFNGMMTAGVQAIADMADIGRIVLYRNNRKPDGLYMSQVYRWDKISGGSTELIPSYSDIPYAQLMPDWEKHLEEGNSINTPVNLLPGPEAAVLKAFGIVAVAVIPIFINNIFWGFMLFGYVRNERSFEDDTIEMMRSAAFFFVFAFMRADLDREIAEQNNFNRTILSAEYQSDGSKTTDKVQEMMKHTLNGETVTEEWIHQTSDGEPIPCEVTLIPDSDLFFPEGSLSLWAVKYW
jgi:hypothetical protein